MVRTLLPPLPQGDPTGGYTHCYLPYLRETPRVGTHTVTPEVGEVPYLRETPRVGTHTVTSPTSGGPSRLGWVREAGL